MSRNKPFIFLSHPSKHPLSFAYNNKPIHPLNNGKEQKEGNYREQLWKLEDAYSFRRNEREIVSVSKYDFIV